jgi:pseudouridine-5'-phosphate glycosidase
VGSTLAIAALAGIRFMATSGLGGVHRGFAERPDISADLAEMTRAPVLVVASGVKSLLDVPATAELLESLSIPVLGWRADTIPLYYVATGGPPVSSRVDSAAEAAAIARHHWGTLHRSSALLLARPPTESLTDVEALIVGGLAEADRDAIVGPAVTPHVLAYVHERSGGRTAAASKQLILDNSALAAQVAVAYAGV